MSAFLPAISPSLTLPVLHVPIYFLSFFMIGKLRVDAICHDYELISLLLAVSTVAVTADRRINMETI